MDELSLTPLGSPLALTLAGTQLIEAGAGTGKTWNIAALVLRLVLETGLSIGEILVVTYTRAATGELRGRIRKRLTEALAAFETGQAEEDFLAELLERQPAWQARARLRLAIESFDTAAIYTIHGFCQRALAEAALAAGQPFERELVAEANELIERVARDVWRNTMAEASPLWAAWLIERLAGPAGLAERVRRGFGRLSARLAAPQADDRLAAERAFAAAYAAARELWRTQSEAILAWLACAKLNQQSYPAEKIRARSEALAAWFANDTPRLPVPSGAEYFGREKITERRTAPTPEPTHPFFAAMDALLAAVARLEAACEAAMRRLAHDCLVAARAAQEEQKRRTGCQTYDDLLVDIVRALEGPNGPALVANLRARYRAALIDEFQDTDPLQLSIFTAVFGDQSHPLIFVGDPKQAIYSFRGADVFAYLAARRQVAAGYALLKNHRSDEPLIHAVNALFERPRPFLLDALPFAAASVAKKERKLCRIDDDQAPLTLWWMSPPAGEKQFSKERATAMAAEAVAADIVRLMQLARQGRASRDGRALTGGDIAVLVRTRRQGEEVRKCLAQRGIASIALGGGSIWHSEEAEELERLLLAIAEPSREGLVRAALATVLYGADSARLSSWAADETAWSAVLERFHEDRRELVERGFAALWRRLLRREGIVPRILARPDGERRMTNYRHLVELLQAAEAAQTLDATGLARHLAAQRLAAETEEHQLRLESDAQLVSIVTIHAAKGLQYPIVYCPFLWDGRKADDKGWPVLAHGAGGAWLDFGSPDLAKLRRAADEEAAAEELRLAYVALTRAEHRCVLIWGKANLCERSPLAWLLFGPREPVEGDWRAWLAEKLKTSGEAALQAELAGLEERLGGALKMSPLPAGGKERAPVANETSVPLAARPFTATIPAPWRILSFSSLAARLAEGEAPDHDARGPLDAVWPAPTFETALAFPRGTHAGSCLHALFERCDFTDLSGLGELVATVLAEFGFSPQWRPALERLVADVVATPLAAGLRLADVASAARLSELEFVFPRAGGGYMKGYIDLVFRHAGRWYIVDWKSNWLGNAPEDYASARLEEVMRRHRYDLQMRIYAAALRRALAAREPELDWPACFGGVFYLFVRGMRPDLPHGIYFARPEVTESALWESET